MHSTLALVLSAATAAVAVTQSGNYTPSYINTPSNTRFVRPASEGLSPNETAWLNTRRPKVISALETYLKQVNVSGLDVASYITALKANGSAVPTIGMTFSGGGGRAFLCGLGVWQAFDARYQPSVAAGTGGLVQALTYISGLSGGSETTLALAMSDFAASQDLLGGGNLYNPAATNESLFGELISKETAGFNVTFADLFAINQANTFLQNGTGTDPFSRRFSDVQSFAGFAAGDTPFPTIMLNEVIPPGVAGSLNINGILYPAFNTSDTTNYEVTPFEYGSWTGRASAFADLRYLGTPMNNGKPAANFSVSGYDTAAFIAGSALSASNLWILQVQSNGTLGQFDRRRQLHARDLERRQSNGGGGQQYGPSYPANEAMIEQQRVARGTADFVDAIPDIIGSGLFQNATAAQLTYALWPNPFQGYNASQASLQGQGYLYLQDGSETGQINPLWPVIQPQRRADFLIVSDNSGTELSSGWMNGTNFQVTSTSARAQNIPFPKLPDSNTFVNFNYTTKPTFFGCNEPSVPLVLYIADSPYTAFSNITPILNTPLSGNQINTIFNNSLANAGQTGGSDKQWASCVACGSILRSLQRLNITVPDVCKSCFSQHCWQGNYTTELPRFVSPSLFNNPNISFTQWNQTVWTPAASQGGSFASNLTGLPTTRSNPGTTVGTSNSTGQTGTPRSAAVHTVTLHQASAALIGLVAGFAVLL